MSEVSEFPLSKIMVFRNIAGTGSNGPVSQGVGSRDSLRYDAWLAVLDQRSVPIAPVKARRCCSRSGRDGASREVLFLRNVLVVGLTMLVIVRVGRAIFLGEPH